MSPSPSAAPAVDPALIAEGRLLGRYILGAPPSEAAVLRYAEKTLRLFAGDTTDFALLRYVARHPWTLPCLDAAAGLVEKDGALRRRLLVMLAILEATPEHAESFLPPEAGTPGPLVSSLRLAGWGAVCALQLAGGLILLPVAKVSG